MSEKTFEELFLEADNFRNNGKVDEAVQAYAVIVEKAQKDNAVPEAARAMQMSAASINSSLNLQTISRYKDSLNYLNKAVSLYRSLNDQVNIGGSYRDMGIAAGKVRDQKAIEYFDKAIAVLEKTDDLGQLAITYDKLGVYYARGGELDQAIANINKALALYDKTSFANFFRATTLYDKARVLILQKKYQESINFALEALSWFQADHDEEQYQERICEISGLIGLSYNALGQEKEAKDYLTSYQAALKKMDAAVVQVLESELSKLFA